MKIYINGRYYSQYLTGAQRYADSVVKSINCLRARGVLPEMEFELVLPPNARIPDGVETFRVAAVGRTTGHFWEQVELCRYARDGVLWSLCNVGPLGHPRQVITMLDAAVFSVPDAFSFAMRSWHRVVMRRLGRIATAIITCSEFSAEELRCHCVPAAGRIHVIPLGGDHLHQVRADTTVLDRFGLTPECYLLTVGTLSPHKNLAALIDAMPHLRTRGMKLAVVGRGKAGFKSPGKVSGTDILYLGAVPDESLRALYENAACFVLPSKYEGFGIPPVEALLCGCPVAVSRAGALPEVLGEAAAYFDPSSPREIAACVAGVLDRRGAGAGSEDAQRKIAAYRWDRTARATLSVLRTAASEHSCY